MKLDVSSIEVNINFELREFFIEPLEASLPEVPSYVVESIIRNHLIPANIVRNELGVPLLVSRSSCFRSVAHERSRNRNGLSLHTFGTHTDEPSEIDKKGACDYTLQAGNMDLFPTLGVLLARLPYTRIIVYPNNLFYHADYNAQNKFFYMAETPASPIQQLRFEQFLEQAEDAVKS